MLLSDGRGFSLALSTAGQARGSWVHSDACPDFLTTTVVSHLLFRPPDKAVVTDVFLPLTPGRVLFHSCRAEDS